MSFYMTLDLQGFDRVLAVREWFRGSNFGEIGEHRGERREAALGCLPLKGLTAIQLLSGAIQFLKKY